MNCRCSDITNLNSKKDKLAKVLNMCNLFTDKNNNCKQELGYLLTDTWNATESVLLQQDANLLPYMSDKLEKAYEEIVNQINVGLEKMDKDLLEMQEEDEEYHKSLEIEI